MAAPGLVCVIGASGFIGRHSVQALRDRGCKVRAAMRRADSEQAEQLKKEGVEVLAADVVDPESLRRCFQGCDVVVNCAGIYRWWVPDDAEYVQVNDVGAGNVAEACVQAGVRRLVHFSTPMAYGYPEEKPFTEASQAGPHASEYARTKHLGDLRTKAVCKGQPIDLAILYLGCTIGEGDTASAGRISRVCRDHMEGRIPMLVGADTNYIYVYIGDVREALIKTIEAESEKLASQDFFIANSDDMMTTRQFFELIAKHTGKPAPKSNLNLTVGFCFAKAATWFAHNITGSEPTAPVDIMRTAKFGSIEYSSQKSKEVLGLQYTSIDAAVAESVADVKLQMAGARL